MRLTFFVFIITLTASIFSCSDPTQLGASLLEEDQANVGFTDTLSIAGSSITIDSVSTYSPFTSNQLLTYLFGNLNDPVFGRSSASIYAQVYPENNNPGFDENTIVDSIVLVLPYDIGNFYAKTEGEEFGVEALQLAESLRIDGRYYSNQDVATEPISIGSAQATVSSDSLEFIDYVGPDTVMLKFPHYRMHLTEAVSGLFVGLDSLTYRSDSLFLDAFKGIYLRSNTENEGMLSFALLSENAGIYLYYRNSTDGTPQRFLYDFDLQSTVRFTRYEHDYTGAPIASFLNSSGQKDSLLFVQGMSGVEARLEIPNLASLQGVVINKAELEIYVADAENSEENFTPIQQLILSAPDSDGELFVIEDISIIRSRVGNNLAALFGGVPLEGSNGSPSLYRMNITAHFQDIIDGQRENVLYIAPEDKSEGASRTVLYGPGHPEYGIKLKLAFTKI